MLSHRKNSINAKKVYMSLNYSFCIELLTLFYEIRGIQLRIKILKEIFASFKQYKQYKISLEFSVEMEDIRTFEHSGSGKSSTKQQEWKSCAHYSVKYLRKLCFSIIFNQILRILQKQQSIFIMIPMNSLCAVDNSLRIGFQDNYCCPQTKKQAQKNLGDVPVQKLNHQKPKQTSILKKKNLECWELQEIQKLFTLYNQYGSQWALIQQQLPDRSANSIKNRFYAVIRALLRHLFISHPEIQNKKLHQIPSKIILKFYQGRKQFSKYKGMGKKLLKAINYDTQSQQLISMGKQKYGQIKAIYEIIYSSKIENSLKMSEDPRNTFQCQNKRSSIKMFENIEYNQSQNQIKEEQVAKSTNQATFHSSHNNGQVNSDLPEKHGNLIYSTSSVNLCVGFFFMIV